VCRLDIHDMRSRERDRLAIHYHQAYQVRHFRSLKAAFLMQRAPIDYRFVHLFDEPQFSLQDGYRRRPGLILARWPAISC
jgi:hypothetical protein